MLDPRIFLPVSGAVIDYFDYFARLPFVKKYQKERKNLSKKIYPKNLRELLEGKVAVLTNLFNPDENKISQIFDLHEGDINGSYIPWLHLALNNGTPEDKNLVERITQGKIGSVELFALGIDKAFNITHTLNHLPKSIDTIVIKDYFSKVEDFSTLLKTIHDFRETGAGACSVNLRPNDDPNYVNYQNKLSKLILRFQEHEYDLSMNMGRPSLNRCSIVSGGFSIFDKKTLESILPENTFDWIGEDFENSVRTYAIGKEIIHDDRTSVITVRSPTTINRLYLQRKGWERARLRVTYDTFLKPAITYLRKAIKLKGNFTDFKFNTHFYGYNGILETALLPLKYAGIAIFGTSAINLIDTLYRTNIIPEVIRLPIVGDYGTSTIAFINYMGIMAAWSGLNLFHLARSKIKNKKERILPAALFPIYKLGLQIGPQLAGQIKFISEYIKINILKDKTIQKFYAIAGGHGIPKPEYKAKTIDIKINKPPKETFRNEFYNTRYHDMMIAKIDSNYAKRFGLGEGGIYGAIDLVDKETVIFPLEKMTQFLSSQINKEDIKFDLTPAYIQEGKIYQNENNLCHVSNIGGQEFISFYNQKKGNHILSQIKKGTKQKQTEQNYSLKDLSMKLKESNIKWISGEETIIEIPFKTKKQNEDPYL